MKNSAIITHLHIENDIRATVTSPKNLPNKLQKSSFIQVQDGEYPVVIQSQPPDWINIGFGSQ